eukprot:7267051-Prymnesium_polylepis.1
MGDSLTHVRVPPPAAIVTRATTLTFPSRSRPTAPRVRPPHSNPTQRQPPQVECIFALRWQSAGSDDALTRRQVHSAAAAVRGLLA